VNGQIITQMWPYIGKLVAETLKKDVEPDINQYLHQSVISSFATPFQFQTTDIGSVVSHSSNCSVFLIFINNVKSLPGFGCLMVCLFIHS